MSTQNSKAKDALLERPAEIDDGTLLRIRQIRPVDKAASPIIDLNLELIDWVRKYRPWFNGKGVKAPKESLSSLIDPKENGFCPLLITFIETVKKFKPGAFPGHCHTVRELEFTTVMLLRELKQIIQEDALFFDAIKDVSNLTSTLADPINGLLSEHDLNQRIDARVTRIVESFAEVVKTLRKKERERDIEHAFKELPPPATKEDLDTIKRTAEKTDRKVDIVLTKQEETRKTVYRLDQRDKIARKNKRMRFTVEKQENVYGYWERAQSNMTLKQESGKHRISYEQVFSYFKRELISLGIKSITDFKDCLSARSDRITYHNRFNRSN